MNMRLIREGLIFGAIGLPCVAVNPAGAADLPSVKESPAPIQEVSDPPAFLKVGLAGVLFNSGANISANGAPVANASASASNNITATFEAGYFITNNISASITAGIPPVSTLRGTGAAAAFGTLGKVTYGPAIVTADYHFKNFGAFQPYIGAGGGYSIIFVSHSAAIQNLNVTGKLGFVLQGGFDYVLSRNWAVFVDAKKYFLSVPATGNLLGAIPVYANVRLDPWIVSAGVSYRF